jgi:serine/threonine-protein kinase
MDTWIGQQLGPYEVQARLGAGGMGVVYRAVHQRLGQARAIKVLPAMLAYDETFLQRFEREARLASELRHPNIVVIHDIAEERGVNYIVMELLDGRSLHDVIRQDGPLPLDRALGLLQQLADALDFAHARGVVHRDIKPGNAIVSPDDHLTLVDFGIARAAEGTRLTEVNSRVGTAEYMSPEAITEGDSGPDTDLYALGIIAYEMLTGRVPFTGVSSQTIMYAQIHTPPPPPRALRTDLSPAIESVVLRQLHKDRSRRYGSGTAFVRSLAAARDALVSGSAAGSAETPSGSLNAAPTMRLERRPPTEFADPSSARASAAPGAAPPMSGPVSAPSASGPASPPSPGPNPARRSGLETTAIYRPGVQGPVSGPRPSAAPGPRTSVPPPPPPTPPAGAHTPPAASAIQRVIDESKLSSVTIYKLAIGGVVLLLLLMSLLPAPHDPTTQSILDRFAFPLAGSERYLLGGDELGRDVLSRLMVGGRALLFRLALVGLVLAGAGLLLRRRIARRTGRTWPSASLLILLVTGGLAASVALELVLGYSGVPAPLRLLGPVGRIFLGVPALPPATTWGGMLAEGREYRVQAPWLPMFPTLGLLLVLVGVVLLGSGIADVVKQRSRQRSQP